MQISLSYASQQHNVTEEIALALRAEKPPLTSDNQRVPIRKLFFY